MKRYIFFVFISLIFSGCQSIRDNKQETESLDHHLRIIYDLNDSTEIIMQLLKENSLKTILLEADSPNSDLMLKNFSPSEMALQAEVLNQQGSSVLIFYKKNSDWKLFEEKLLEIAQKYPPIKFVKIDTDILFRVTQNAEVEKFPAIIFVKNGNEIARIEPISLEGVQEVENSIKNLTM